MKNPPRYSTPDSSHPFLECLKVKPGYIFRVLNASSEKQDPFHPTAEMCSAMILKAVGGQPRSFTTALYFPVHG